MNLVLPTFQADFLLCVMAEWITRQTSNLTSSSSNPADRVFLQFIWVFMCFLQLMFALVIIRAANTTVSAGKKVDHTLFIILLLLQNVKKS